MGESGERVGMEKGDVFAEESFKFGEILGSGKGETGVFFLVECPLAWAIFGGMEGKNEAPFAEEIPPERAKTGAVLEGGERAKMTTKKDP